MIEVVGIELVEVAEMVDLPGVRQSVVVGVGAAAAAAGRHGDQRDHVRSTHAVITHGDAGGANDLVDGIELIDAIARTDAIAALVDSGVIVCAAWRDAGVDALPTAIDHPLEIPPQYGIGGV